MKDKAHQDSDWVWQRDELGRVHRVNLETGKGSIALHGVSRIITAKNNGVLVLSGDMLHCWSDQANTRVEGLRGNGGFYLLASSSHNLLISLRGKDGLVQAYSMESFRALR